MSGRLAGKRALVTGAAQGIGAAIARALVAEGARVLLTDLNGEGAAEQARALSAEFGVDAALSCRHDVTSEADWSVALALAQSALGGLSVLVNNAGIGLGGTLETTSMDHWHRAFSVNVDSVFLGCKLALPLLRDSQPASIINMSSIAGLIAGAGMLPYNASKAAVWMMSKSIALECARSGWDIRCNSVHPAFVDTPILDAFRPHQKDHAETVGKLGAQVPLKRVGLPSEIAAGVVYLASDESRFMTGAELKLDGGISAG